MALGRRKRDVEQPLFVTPDQLPQGDAHPFYRKLNLLLAEGGFDPFAEEACRKAYDQDGMGRPGIPPGVYFRMLFVGYFEGLDSQRGIAWRCQDSAALRRFLGLGLLEPAPDHSSLTKVRKRLPTEAHEQVFEFMLKLAREKKLLDPKAVGVDSTTLEANAAMKSIVRRDTGAGYQEYLKKLAEAAGLQEPSAEELRRFDRKRKDKTCSNEDWESPADRDAEIARMKDGTTHLAYKAEHVVDLDSEFLLAARVLPATAHDATTLADSVMVAQGHLDAAATLAAGPRTEAQHEAAVGAGPGLQEVVADKGYYKAKTLAEVASTRRRTYIPEPARPKADEARNAAAAPAKKSVRPRKARPNRGPRRARRRRRTPDRRTPEERRAVRNNAARVARAKSRKLQRRRSEVVERSMAHVCETGGARRTWLRGLENVQKRYLCVAAARNLGLLMLKLFKVGKPRGMQDRGRGRKGLAAALERWRAVLEPLRAAFRLGSAIVAGDRRVPAHLQIAATIRACSTGC